MGSEKLIPLKTFKFLPEMSDRQAWEAIKNDPTKKKYIDEIFREAELAATTPIPVDSAKLFMEFHRTGKLTAYETNHFARRSRLVNLVLAEALEYKGRFIDDIIEHLYAIEAEYTWTIPAHDADWKVTYCPTMSGTEGRNVWYSVEFWLTPTEEAQLGKFIVDPPCFQNVKAIKNAAQAIVYTEAAKTN